MSLLDNMMLNNNGKNQKQSSYKKTTKVEHKLGSDKEKETFNEEFSEGLMNDVSRFGIQSYSKAGVTFEKLSETQARINYTGLLAKGGAQEISGVYGFGSNQKWEDVSNLTLNKEGESSFSGVISVEQGKNVNLAFRDAGENWDNNSGMNYTFVN